MDVGATHYILPAVQETRMKSIYYKLNLQKALDSRYLLIPYQVGGRQPPTASTASGLRTSGTRGNPGFESGSNGNFEYDTNCQQKLDWMGLSRQPHFLYHVVFFLKYNAVGNIKK